MNVLIGIAVVVMLLIIAAIVSFFMEGSVVWNYFHSRSIGQTPWFSFEGRARRSEYWEKYFAILFLLLFVGLPLILIPAVVVDFDNSYAWVAILSIVAGSILALFCGIALWPVTARRFHDRGMSGWWILWFSLLNCIPFVSWIADIVQFVILGCMDGIPGPNRYGPDPKGRNQVQGKNACPIVGIVNNNMNVNSTASANVEERLSKLTKLKDSGVISEAEYEQKRSQILSEL